MLGAGLNGDKPSAVLEMRLERAHLYLQEHPQTIIIVSGGQGPTEPVSEVFPANVACNAQGTENMEVAGGDADI